jgi:hypothetical protein
LLLCSLKLFILPLMGIVTFIAPIEPPIAPPKNARGIP